MPQWLNFLSQLIQENGFSLFFPSHLDRIWHRNSNRTEPVKYLFLGIYLGTLFLKFVGINLGTLFINSQVLI